MPPSLPNGTVSGQGDGSSWTGVLSCKPGFILVGSSRLKCRSGQWSARIPVCTGIVWLILSNTYLVIGVAIGGCDPDSLPGIPHGRKDPYKTTMYRGAVYKYSCNRGFKRVGSGLVHCDGNTWDTSRVPICASKQMDFLPLIFLQIIL